MLGMRLCVLHNLYFYNTMMTEIRDALDEGRFAEYKRNPFLVGYTQSKKSTPRSTASRIFAGVPTPIR